MSGQAPGSGYGHNKGNQHRSHRHVFATVRPSWLITPTNRRNAQPSTGKAQPDRRRVGIHSEGRRNCLWVELDDDSYTQRFETLCFVYHPAVAAVMAHDATAGPGASRRRITGR
jgi:hypothetical protein